MRDKFLQLPQPIQKQILLRCVGTGLGVLMLILVIAYGGDWRFLLPCVAVIGVSIISAGALFHRCTHNRYVVILGHCTEIERITLRKRIKSLYLQTEDHSVRIVGVKQIRNLAIGDLLRIYVADNTAVYDVDGCKVICNYITMTKETGAQAEEKRKISD